jgi:hypothetical protein
MGKHMDDFSITLRVTGESLEPDRVTKLVGSPPTDSFRRGDPVSRRGKAAQTPRKYGSWQLSVEADDAEKFSAVLRDLLARVPTHFAQAARREQWAVDVFVGLFGVHDQSTLQIDVDVLRELSLRGWPLCFDMYN